MMSRQHVCMLQGNAWKVRMHRCRRFVEMKKIAVCFALFSACASFAVDVAALPDSSFADTEVSTNFTFAVGGGSNRRLVFSLELQASPSNNVEVAIGCDADNDGRLSLDETALAVGYDCGEWFVRTAAKDSVTYSDVADAGTFCRIYEVRSRHIDRSWNLVKVTRRGRGVSNENVSFAIVESGFGLTIR